MSEAIKPIEDSLEEKSDTTVKASHVSIEQETKDESKEEDETPQEA